MLNYLMIRKLIERSKKENKHLIILSGRMLSEAITIKLCDIVILADNTSSLDLYKQRIERGSTPNKNKNDSYVLDLNIHRALRNIME